MRKHVSWFTGLLAVCVSSIASAQVSISLPKLNEIALQAGVVPPQTTTGDHTPSAVMWTFGVETLFNTGGIGPDTPCRKSDLGKNAYMAYEKSGSCDSTRAGDYCRLEADTRACVDNCNSGDDPNAKVLECTRGCSTTYEEVNACAKAAAAPAKPAAKNFLDCLHTPPPGAKTLQDHADLYEMLRCDATSSSATCRLQAECDAGVQSGPVCNIPINPAAPPPSPKTCHAARIEVGLGYFESTMAGRNPLLASSSAGVDYEFSGNIRSLPRVAIYLNHDYASWGVYFGVATSLAKISGYSYPPGQLTAAGASVGYQFSADTLSFGARIGLYKSLSDVVSLFTEFAFDRYAFSNLQYTLTGTTVIPDEFPRQLSWNQGTLSVGIQFDIVPP